MNKKLLFGFGVLEVSYWSFHACFLLYVMAYLKSLGVSNTFLGLFVALYFLAGFISSFLWGYLCDKYQTNRKLFLPLMILSLLLSYGLYFMGGHTVIAAVLYIGVGFLFHPTQTNIDSWFLSYVGSDTGLYGKIRCLPSLAYSFLAVIVGRCISANGYHVMLIGGTIAMVTAIVAGFLMPDAREKQLEEHAQMSLDNIRRLMSNGNYRLLIFLLFFIGVSIAPLNNLKIVIMNNVGAGVAEQGVDSFVGALTQVPFIAIAGITRRIPFKVRFMLMSICPLLMILLTYLAAAPAMIYVGTMLYNIGYGILLPTMREVTEANVDPALRNVGHNLADAVFLSISSMLGLVFSGLISDLVSVSFMLLICLLISVIPNVLMLISLGKGARTNTTAL